MRFKKLIILSALLLTSCSTGLDAGRRALKSGNYDEAQKQAIIALSTDPRNPEVYYLSAEAALGQKQYALAQKSAEFANSLDGGSERSEALIRQALVGQKSWSGLCDAGLRAVKKGYALNAAELDDFKAAYENQAGKASAYGCLKSLNALGIDSNDDTVKALYAANLASHGQNAEAYEIEITVADPAISELRASRRLYAMHRTEEGDQLLRRYVEGGDASSSENRIESSFEVCEEYRRWALENELLARSSRPENEIRRGIALRRSFHPEEADEVFRAHFERTDKDPASTLKEVEMLCAAGYAETAAQAYFACTSCAQDIEVNFKAAEKLYDAGQGSACSRILTQTGEAHQDDSALQLRIFRWYLKHGMRSQALSAAEKASALGIKDDDFEAERLNLYVDAREIRQFERASEEWIKRSEAPAAFARTTVAKLETRRGNWDGAIELLKPVAQAEALTKESRELYFKALQVTQQYPTLLTEITKHAPNLDALDKAAYFEDAEAEKEFMACVEPLLKGDTDDQIRAELAIATYQFEVKHNEEAGYAAAARALEASGKTSQGYQRITGYLKHEGANEKAIEYANAWVEAYPQTTAPHEFLGELYLALHEPESAKKSYDRYYELQSNKKDSLRPIFNLFTNYSEQESGLAWLESHVQKDDMDQLEILARSRSEMSRSLADRTEAIKQRNAAIKEYQIMLDKRPEQAIHYGYAFGTLNDEADALKAFDIAHQKQVKMDANDRMTYIRYLLRANRGGEEIRAIVNQTEKENEIPKMIEFLEAEQALEYGDALLEKQLASKDIETRISAYEYLYRMYISTGNAEKIKEISAILEDSGANSAAIRMKLAETALSTNQFTEALRHLTYLQAIRPDARDVMALEVKLARRVPNDTGAQSLLSSTIDAAEGIHHRLDWLSQIYEQYGNTERALYFGEKAFDAAGSAATGEQRIRLILLNLRAGKSIESDAFRGMIEELKSNGHWRSENIITIAEAAEENGYYDQAQQWMQEAISQSPEDREMKRRSLEVALNSESEGRIANSLEKAIETPLADVITPLVDKGSILDTLSTIELLMQNGEHGMAYTALMDVLPQYVEVYGVTTTRRTLENLAETNPYSESSIINTLARQQLIGDAPCDALSYITKLTAPDVWGGLLHRCSDARESIMSSIHEYRSALTHRTLKSFDQTVYQTLVDEGNATAASIYADEVQMTSSAYERFERLLKSGDALSALQSLAEEEVAGEEIGKVSSALASHGYARETIDYIRENMSKAPASEQANLAATAVLLGGSDAIFEDTISAHTANDLNALTTQEKVRTVSAKILEKWLTEVSTAQISSVIEIIMACAAENADKRKSMMDAIDREIAKRTAKSSLYIAASQAASANGLHEDALRFLKQLRTLQPALDYAHRVISKEHAALGEDKDAWASLEEGARCTTQLDEYWKKSAELHTGSSVWIRQNINNSRLQLQPHRADLLAIAAGLALENGQIEEAQDFAKTAYQAGRTGALKPLIEAFEAGNGMAQFPDEIIAEHTGSAYMAKAKKYMAQGDDEQAAEYFAKAANQSPWPSTVYADAIESYRAKGNLDRVEQLSSLWLRRYPHSSMAYANHAVYALEKNQPDEAWKDYLSARAHAFETDSWIVTIIRETARINDVDFARRVYKNEQEHGTLNRQLWLASVVPVFLDETTAKSKGMTSQEFANAGLRYIEKVLGKTGTVMNHDEQLREKMNILAQKSQGKSTL